MIWGVLFLIVLWSAVLDYCYCTRGSQTQGAGIDDKEW